MILNGKKILIIGGTGSLGKKLIKRILSGELGTPEKVTVLSRDEAKQHDMRISYQHKQVATDEVIYRNFMETLEFRIGDIRNYPDVCAAVKNADIIVNVAALKQVPICEYFPEQAMMTNCMGMINVVRAIEENKLPVKTVVAISTDKACKPVNVMGMTKSIQERIFVAANVACPDTRFIGVRYGNVLASRGSVIPLFHYLIRNGGPVTITDTGMTRFLLSLDRAVDTVFAAMRNAGRGEIYIPKVPSVTVQNVAKALIGNREIDIEVTGVRPGEKLHEILVSEEEVHHCVDRKEHYSIVPMLPELREPDMERQNTLTKELSSADMTISFDETVELLRRHELMVEDIQNISDGECLS